MELLKDILVNILMKEEVNIIFPNLRLSVAEMIETESFKALQKIKAVVEDDDLSDFDCMEQIISIFEEIESDGGSRHDFG